MVTVSRALPSSHCPARPAQEALEPSSRTSFPWASSPLQEENSKRFVSQWCPPSRPSGFSPWVDESVGQSTNTEGVLGAFIVKSKGVRPGVKGGPSLACCQQGYGKGEEILLIMTAA